ncbi:MAG: hypothetical protein L0241_04875 [Planctomycetia bacterium]|nr:hypothetical protein [Planctomycetia bacterium]
MKSHTEYLTFHLPARMAFVNMNSPVGGSGTADLSKRNGRRQRRFS